MEITPSSTMSNYCIKYLSILSSLITWSNTNWIMVADREIPRFRYVELPLATVEWTVDNIEIKHGQEETGKAQYEDAHKNGDNYKKEEDTLDKDKEIEVQI